jgi:hypothetical protein
MEVAAGIATELGIIKGREIYLNEVIFKDEHAVFIKGTVESDKGARSFELRLGGILFYSTIELDFDKRTQPESLAMIMYSTKIAEFKKHDHASKLKRDHNHYYLRTYNTVFEAVANEFDFQLVG